MFHGLQGLYKGGKRLGSNNVSIAWNNEGRCHPDSLLTGFGGGLNNGIGIAALGQCAVQFGCIQLSFARSLQDYGLVSDVPAIDRKSTV